VTSVESMQPSGVRTIFGPSSDGHPRPESFIDVSGIPVSGIVTTSPIASGIGVPPSSTRSPSSDTNAEHPIARAIGAAIQAAKALVRTIRWYQLAHTCTGHRIATAL